MDSNQMENWINSPIIDNELFCDPSDFAWEGFFETKPAGGSQYEAEKKYHINEKEITGHILYFEII